jgi:hypothetical protein
MGAAPRHAGAGGSPHPGFSYGSYPPGPVRLDERKPEALASARFGPHLVNDDEMVFGGGATEE